MITKMIVQFNQSTFRRNNITLYSFYCSHHSFVIGRLCSLFTQIAALLRTIAVPMTIGCIAPPTKRPVANWTRDNVPLFAFTPDTSLWNWLVTFRK